MAIRFLEEEFLKKMDGIYNKHSTKEGRDLGYRQPYLEIKPNDKNMSLYTGDMMIESRGTPIIRPAQDLIRIGKFLTTPRGVVFMGLQSLLQTGNTFTETRIVDPTWIIKNLDPYKHNRRNATSADEFGFENTNSFIGNAAIQMVASPGSYNVGKAGRLHRETADKVTGKSAKNNLTPSQIARTIAASVIPGLGNLNYQGANSILGINQRPELNVDGKWYIIELRNNRFPNVGAFASKPGGNRGAGAGFTGPLTISNVTNTLVKKATSWIEKKVQQFVNKKVNEILNNKKYSWLRPLVRLVNPKMYDKLKNDIFAYRGSYGVFTHRYFIVDKGTSARRYLKKRGESTGNTDNTSFLRGNGFLLGETADLTDYNDSMLPSLLIRHTVGTSLDTIDHISPHLATIEAQKQQWITSRNDEVNQIISDLQNKQPKANVLLPGTSNGLGYKYSDKNTSKIDGSDSLYDDTPAWLFTKTNSENYHSYLDKINLIEPYQEFKNNSDSSQKTDAAAESDLEKDLIDFKIRVFGAGGKTVRFRSIIERFNTDIKPTFAVTQYIGRIEKNITYSGVERACNIDFIVHAFSPDELLPIWQKLNYLTSMAFPKEYNNGYMVPPLLKLTIGNIFKDQPVYLNSLNYSIDENTSWDTLTELQVPMTVMVSAGFTIIEKNAMSITGQRSFYNLIPQTEEEKKTLIESVLGKQSTLLSNKVTKAINSPLGKKVLSGLQKTVNQAVRVASETSKKDVQLQSKAVTNTSYNSSPQTQTTMKLGINPKVPLNPLPPLKKP